MLERTIELKFVKEVKKTGGIALKLVCPGFIGMPDRLVLMPKGKMFFAEMKAPGQKPRPVQVKRHEMLRGLGCRVFVLDDERQIPALMIKMMGGGDAT